MKKKTVVAFMTALTLSISLSACDSIPTSNSDASKIEELEQEIDELRAENKELKAKIKNLDLGEENQQLAEENQQSNNEVESLLKTTVESPETSGVCGANLTWYYQNGVLAITGTGEMTDYSSSEAAPWYDLRDKIGWVIIDDGATTVGEYTFTYCNVLSKVILPSTLVSIGGGAFYNCGSIKEITLPSTLVSISEDAFRGCNAIKEITFKGNLPEGIDSIIWRLPDDRMVAAADGRTLTREEVFSALGISLIPMTIYYSGNTFDEYISSYPYWSDYGVNWIKQ